jgi:hypothetical protein
MEGYDGRRRGHEPWAWWTGCVGAYFQQWIRLLWQKGSSGMPSCGYWEDALSPMGLDELQWWIDVPLGGPMERR